MRARYGFIVEDAEGCAVFPDLASALEYARLAIIHGSRELTIKAAILTYSDEIKKNRRRARSGRKEEEPSK